MLRVSDSAGPTRDSLYSVLCRIAFPLVVHGRHPKLVISELNGWPALPPVNASRATSRLHAHDSGPQWSSFSFHVGLFHPLLYAGLSRRFHNVPYSFRYFGTITTWYLQSQRTCDKLCQSCIGSSSLFPQWGFPGGRAYFISRRNGRTFPGPPLKVVA